MSINNSFAYNRNMQDSDIDVKINEHISEHQLLRKSNKPFGTMDIAGKRIEISMRVCNEIIDDCASAWSLLNLKNTKSVIIEVSGNQFQMNAERIELLADTLQRTKDVVLKKYRFG
jgi:hypothetical protein